MELSYRQVLEKLLQKQNLSSPEALWLMEATMSGNLSQVQVAGWLCAARSKGETGDEIAAFAKIMREKAERPPGLKLPLVDTCGTGGDKSNLINVSTLSALVLAARGIPVAKHGNRAVSSAAGSADLLEHLGYPMDEKPEKTAERIRNKNFGFLFAPNFHPAMKYAGPVRKELGIRTVFNILGPLSNPASANVHLIGVFQESLLDTIAESLHKLGVDTALVVHSQEGLDEISPLHPTHYRLLHQGNISAGEIDPKPFKFTIHSLSQVQAGDRETAFEKAQRILAGKDRPGTELVSLNVVAAMYLWELHHGRAKESLQIYMEKNLSGIIDFIENGSVKISEMF